MDQARRRLPFHRPTTVPSTSTIPSKVFSTSPERRYTPSTSTPSSSPTTASSSPLPTSPYSPAHYNLFPRAHHASRKATPPSTHGRDTVLIRRHQSPDEISHTRDPSDRRARRTREEDAESYAYARTQSAFAGECPLALSRLLCGDPPSITDSDKLSMHAWDQCTSSANSYAASAFLAGRVSALCACR